MGKLLAKVAVSKAVYAIDRPYDYLVPEPLEQTVCPGNTGAGALWKRATAEQTAWCWPWSGSEAGTARP